MLDININDVIEILNLCKPYFIIFGIVLIIAITAMILCRRLTQAKKYLIRSQAGIAIVLVTVLMVNLICFGPMLTIISLATGHGVIKEETNIEAQALVTEIANEGIVLLENESNILPLSSTNLNVFGWASTNPCYGGTGSGALSDSYPIVTLLEGLEHAGFNLNSELSDFYTAYRDDRPVVGMRTQDWTLPEPPAESYSTEIISNAKNFSDTALIVISRVGGEGADLPTDMSTADYINNSESYDDFAPGSHYLELTKTEQNMINLVCNNFDNVIVIYNGANAFELGFVKDYDQIKGVIWCPGTGQTGFDGLSNILSGKVNPSGKTVDTFVADLTATPYFNNIGDFTYDNMDEYGYEARDNITLPTFVNYVEGIYVGYRFYETAAFEGLIDYEQTVVYPFGYGLSYTDFTQEMGDIKVGANDTLSFDVTITNTGLVDGKDVVQVYYNPPYTNGGIEKATANLVAFYKTDLLSPGASQTVTISFNLEDMASYDSYGMGCYVLEAGNYGISIRSDSHTIIKEQNYMVENDVIYDESNKRSTDNVASVNQFESAEGDVVYLSRQDSFSNYAQAVSAPNSLSMSAQYMALFINNGNYSQFIENNLTDVMPTTSANNGLSLVSMRGLSYEDSAWEALLDQLTITDMNNLIALGGFQTAAISSINKIGTIDCDGPASINNNFTGVGSIGFPSAVMIASTWSEELAEAFGESIGKMADEMGVSGWYAPAMNTHRSAFGGRNFEYYSEDGVLSGRIAANAVIGAEKFGVYAYLKHYALNDQEINRNNMICTWVNEQAIREIYLKPFELAVKEGGAKAMMSAFNYIGTEWVGANKAMMTTVLRDEWGFRGFVLTDFFAGNGYGYMNSDQGIRGGNDVSLATYDAGTNYVSDTTNATTVLAMRQSSKNILYTVVNSRAYNEDSINTGLLNWQIAGIVIDVLILAALVVIELLIVKKGYNKRKKYFANVIEE